MITTNKWFKLFSLVSLTFFINKLLCVRSQQYLQCYDGCIIPSIYYNDGYFCDCSQCEDEPLYSCYTCGGCPTYCGDFTDCSRGGSTSGGSWTTTTRIPSSPSITTTSAPASAPVFPTIITTTQPLMPTTGQLECYDGCIINSLYYNDGFFCDCSQCEDEPSYSCLTCGGCPASCGDYVDCTSGGGGSGSITTTTRIPSFEPTSVPTNSPNERTYPKLPPISSPKPLPSVISIEIIETGESIILFNSSDSSECIESSGTISSKSIMLDVCEISFCSFVSDTGEFEFIINCDENNYNGNNDYCSESESLTYAVWFGKIGSIESTSIEFDITQLPCQSWQFILNDFEVTEITSGRTRTKSVTNSFNVIFRSIFSSSYNNKLELGVENSLDKTGTFSFDLDFSNQENNDMIWNITTNLKNYESQSLNIQYNGPNSIINFVKNRDVSSSDDDNSNLQIQLFCDDCTDLVVNLDGSASSSYGSDGLLSSYFGIFCEEPNENLNKSGTCNDTTFNFNDETGIHYVLTDGIYRPYGY